MINKTLLFERLMENVTETVFFKDLESRFIAINKSGALKFGVENPEEIIGKTDFDFFAKIHAQKALDDERQILETLEPILDQVEREVFNDEAKTVKWTSTSKFPLFDEAGNLIGTYGLTKDITEEKKRYEEISRLKEQVEAILNSVPSLIFVKDRNGKYLMANQATKDYFDPNCGEVIGKTDIELGISKERAERYLRTDTQVINSRKAVFYPEEKTERYDGVEKWHQTIKVPFSIASEDDVAALSVITDVTKRIQYEVELTESVATISKQNERLSNFAHIVSHNLRNYAGGISMLVGLIEEAESEQEKDELFELLSSASDRLNETIKDLNDIIDKQNKVEADLKELRFKEVFDGIKEILQPEISKHEVVIEEDIDPELTIKYSPAYLESILLNLLSNAVKYRCPERPPLVKFRAWFQDGTVKLEVQDNGRGIDLTRYGNTIFGMYKTFHDNSNSKGIGLYITKNQVEALGGSIKVESEPKVGSTFFVEFGKQHRNKMLVPA